MRYDGPLDRFPPPLFPELEEEYWEDAAPPPPVVKDTGEQREGLSCSRQGELNDPPEGKL